MAVGESRAGVISNEKGVTEGPSSGRRSTATETGHASRVPQNAEDPFVAITGACL
jgi:hypothetical protein